MFLKDAEVDEDVTYIAEGGIEMIWLELRMNRRIVLLATSTDHHVQMS